MSGVHIRGLEEAMWPDRLFPVRTHEHYGFYAGRAADGRQLLAAADGRDLLVAVLDPGGDLVVTHQWQLSADEGAGESLRRRFGWP